MDSFARLKTKRERFCRTRKQKGTLTAVRKGLHTVVIKPVTSRINYVRYHKAYPQPVIFIAGFAKSGSTWIANMLAELDGFERYEPGRWQTRASSAWDDRITSDLYEGCFDEFRHRLAVIKGHTHGTERNMDILNRYGYKVLLSVRDPRDTIISAYHYIRNHPDHWDYIHASQMSLSAYISYKLKSGDYEQQLVNWLRGWKQSARADMMMILRYEDALSAPCTLLKAVFSHLCIDVSDEKIEQIVSRHEFASLTGRARGVENTNDFCRKGVTGEWKQVFSHSQKTAFSYMAKDVIEWLGYEPTLPDPLQQNHQTIHPPSVVDALPPA